MYRPTLFVFAVVAIAATAAPRACHAQTSIDDADFRIWRARTGSYSTKAALVKLEEGIVHLKKQDGTLVSLPLDKLSDADQHYVKRWSGINKTAEASLQVTSAEKAAVSEMETGCRKLCAEITRSYRGKDAGEKPTIAVVEFSDLSGDVTDFGRLLSEELITGLFSTGNYKVVERFLLNKAIADHKLQLQGLVDPESAKELGKILGVDAIVSGTVADLGDSLRVNARLISTETGEVFSVAATTIGKDDSIKRLLGVSGGNTSATMRASRDGQGKIQLPFREDFSSYKDGEKTDWGPAAKVKTGADARQWLVPVGIGQRPIGIDIGLPQNAFIEFDYNASQLESKYQEDRALSAITLVDEAGAKFRVEFVIAMNEGTSLGHWAEYTIKLPGGTSVSDSNSDFGDHETSMARGTIRILRTGDTITVIRDGARKGVTAKVSDFKDFTRFELDIYKGRNAMVAFTNFKIGKSHDR